MRKSVAVLAVATAIFGAGAVLADDHLVSREEATERLDAATGARESDLGAIDRALGSAQARTAADRLGANLVTVRAAATTLSDGELRGLAERARALDADPAAGMDPDIRELLIIFLIVAIVILVLKAVD
ncbi:MAG: hypothetical protein HY317_00005 [Acidobacteria bacterium]|nr:hypothetical protein [Acidobacteriota bacterium]